jgi:hypothetical protein
VRIWAASLYLILAAGLGGLLIALGIDAIITGDAFGRHGAHYTRSGSPIGFWIETGFRFVFGIGVIVAFGRAFLNRRSSADEKE